MALEDALVAGMTEAQFWEATPFQTRLSIAAFNRRQDMNTRLAIVQAWHGALYQRVKKFPDLRSVLDGFDRKPMRRKTSAEVIHLFEHMTVQLGGKDLRRPSAAKG